MLSRTASCNNDEEVEGMALQRLKYISSQIMQGRIMASQGTASTLTGEGHGVVDQMAC